MIYNCVIKGGHYDEAYERLNHSDDDFSRFCENILKIEELECYVYITVWKNGKVITYAEYEDKEQAYNNFKNGLNMLGNKLTIRN